MESLKERVRQTILRERLCCRGERVLVGVSGGPDSVALLHLLVGLQQDLSMRLVAVHVDHQLRPESASDAVFVEDLGTRLEVPVVVIRRDVLRETKARKLSLEEGARQIRYEAFREVGRQQAADRLALAHTADDQAETVLMRLLRGAGPTGLTAIPMTRPLGPLQVIRPLLGVWRREIMAYVAEQQLHVREDRTNEDPRFLRNRIRGHLLPLLERDYNPNIKVLLSQLADQCRAEVAFLQGVAERYWRRLVKCREGRCEIRIAGLLDQPTAVQRQLVRSVVHRLQGDLDRFEFRHWLEIERLFTGRPVGTILDLPGDLQFVRGREWVTARLVPPSTRAGAEVRGRQMRRTRTSQPVHAQ